MYKIFIRDVGSQAAPSSFSYELLNDDGYTGPKVIFDLIAPNISRYVSEPKLTMSAEEAGQLSFDIDKGHPFYSKVISYATEVMVYEDDDCIWLGRIIDVDISMTGTKSVTAEGILAYFNDTNVSALNRHEQIPITWDMWELLDLYIRPVVDFSSLNPTFKKLHAPVIDIIEDYIERADRTEDTLRVTIPNGVDYQSAKQLLETALSAAGGYYYIIPSKRLVYNSTTGTYEEQDGTVVGRLIYRRERPEYLTGSKCVFNANESSNFTDLKQNYDISSFATAIYPLGAKDPTKQISYDDALLERVDISGATTIPSGFTRAIVSGDTNKAYLYNSSAVEQFGWIEKLVTYNDLTDPNTIAKEAAKDLTASLLQTRSTDISFDSLIDNDGKPHMPRLFDWVKINAPFNNIVLTEPRQIVDLSIDLMDPSNSTVSLSVVDYKLVTKLIK